MNERAATFQFALLGLPLLLFLSFYELGGSLSQAEQHYLERAAAPFADALGSLYGPLYLLLMKAWVSVGDSERWLRCSGLLAAGAALLLSDRVVRNTGGAHAAPGALLLLAGAPFLIAQVHVLSPAPFAMLAVVAGFFCFIEFIRTGSLRWLGAWVLTALLSLGLQAGLLFVLPAQGLYMVVYRDRFRSRQMFWWFTQLPILALFYLAFGTTAELVWRSRLGTHMPDVQNFMEIPARLALIAANLTGLAGIGGAGLFLILTLGGIWNCRDWRQDTRHGLLLLGFLAPILLYLSPVGHPSFALAALPFFCTLLSMCIRNYGKWMRQLWWSAIGLCYFAGYWTLYH